LGSFLGVGMFDAHCHLQDKRFAGEVAAVVKRFRACGGERMLCCGTSVDDWAAVNLLAENFCEVVPAFGIHPWFVGSAAEDWCELLRGYLRENPRAAVGEIGLDGAVNPEQEKLQLDVFMQQLELAVEFERPVSVHCVKAWGKLLSALKSVETIPTGVVIHSFSGSVEMLRELTELGVSFSFSGSVTNPAFRRAADIVRAVAADRLLIETDAPDMRPYGVAAKHNEPANLIYVADKVAELRGMSVGDVIDLTAVNAERVFGE